MWTFRPGGSRRTNGRPEAQRIRKGERKMEAHKASGRKERTEGGKEEQNEEGGREG